MHRSLFTLLSASVLLIVFATTGAFAAPAPTTTTLAVSPSSVSYHDLVTLTASVADSSGSPVLHGTVTFSGLGPNQPTQTVQLVASNSGGFTPGTAILKLRSLPSGTLSLTATFNGTNTLAVSTSTQTVTVSAAPAGAFSTIDLSSTGNTNGQYGLNATVKGFGTVPLSGTVTFTDTTSGMALGSLAISPNPNSPGFESTTVSGLTWCYDAHPAATGDFNGDGNLDLLAIVDTSINCRGLAADQDFAVLLGNGDGTFQMGPTYSGANYPLGYIVGDFDGDGNLDFAVAQGYAGYPPYTGPSILMYLGNGDGSFRQAASITVAPPNQPAALATGDFNGDGIPDLAAITGINLGIGSYVVTTSAEVMIFPGNGDGTFGSALTTTVSFAEPQYSDSSYPAPQASLAVGDLNHDGKLDIVMAEIAQALVLLGNGDGSFQTPAPYSVGDSTQIYRGNTYGQVIATVALTDLNQDGNLDILATSWGVESGLGQGNVSPMPAQFSVLPGNGSGTFPAYTTYPVPIPSTYSPAIEPGVIGDFDHDGKLDVAVGVPDTSTSTNILLFAGNGDGTLQTVQSFPFPSASVIDPIEADFRGDGIPGLIGTSYTSLPAVLSLLEYSSGGTASLSKVTAPGTGTQQVVASYSDDANYAVAYSNPVGLDTRAHVTLTGGFLPAIAGTTETATIYATVPTGSPTPTGTITCSLSTPPIGSPVLATSPPAALSAGAGSCTFAFPTVGNYLITEAYSGDANYQPAVVSNINLYVETVGDTSLSFPSPVVGAQASGVPITTSLDLTLDAAGPAPTGTISLQVDGTAIAQVPVSGNPPAAVSFTFNTPDHPIPAGNHVIAGNYSGDSVWVGSSTFGNQTINFLPSDVSLTSNLQTYQDVFLGYSLQFAATVATIGSRPAPTGTIQFYDGTTAIGAPVPLVNATTNFTSSSFSAADHSITAVYSGDGNYPASTSAPIAFTVVAQGTVNLTATTSSHGASYLPGAPFLATGYVAESPLVLGAPSPTGLITVYLNGTALGSGDAAARTVSFTVNTASSPLPIGPYALTATYAGDANWKSATAAPFNFAIAKGTLAFYNMGTNPRSPVNAGTPTNAIATLGTQNPNGLVPFPTGVITLLEDGNSTGLSFTLSSSSQFEIRLNTPTAPLTSGTHALSFSYAGDANWLPEISGNLNLTINSVLPTFALTSNLGSYGSVVQGTTVTFTATTSGTLGTPTGTVQFYLDGVAAGGPVTITNGVATYSVSSLAAGSHTVTAGYSGDSYYGSVTTNGVVTVVTQGPDVVTVALNTPSSIPVGTPATVSGTLSTGALGPPPTGTVQLLDNGASVASMGLSGNPPFALSFTVNTASKPLPVGAHSFVLSYGGAPLWAASASAAAPLSITKATTTTALTTSNASIAVDASVTFTAVVAPTSGTLQPTGTVQFYDGTTALGSPVTLSGGSAAYSTSTLTAGAHSITAAYSGDTTFSASTSAVVTQTITSVFPTLSLTSNLGSYGSVVQGTAVTFTATASGTLGTPSGTIQFTIDKAPAGGPVTLANGVATYTTSSLAAGTHAVTAVYSGSSSYGPTTTNGAVTVATQGTDVLSLTASGPSSVGIGVPITLSGTLTATSLGPSPTGTVQLLDNGSSIASTTLSGDPPFALSFTVNTTSKPLAIGAHSFTLSYGGATLWASSTSPAAAVSIVKDAATTSLTTSAASVAVNASVTFTAVVAPTSSTLQPTGTVQFYDGTTALGSPVTLAGGLAAYSTSTLTAGAHSITAAYSGDTTFSASTSVAVTEMVEDFTLQTGGTSVTVNPGGSATVKFSVAAEGGLDTTVTFACSGLPRGAACSFAPPTVTGSGSTTLTITTTSDQATLSPGALPWLARGATLVACVFWLGLPLRRRRKNLLLCGLFAVLLLGLAQGCGGGSGGGGGGQHNESGTPAGTYSIAVQVTAGSGASAISHTTTISLIVN